MWRIRGRAWTFQPGQEKDHGVDTVVASPASSMPFSHCGIPAGLWQIGPQLGWALVGLQLSQSGNSHPLASVTGLEMGRSKTFQANETQGQVWWGLLGKSVYALMRGFRKGLSLCPSQPPTVNKKVGSLAGCWQPFCDHKGHQPWEVAESHVNRLTPRACPPRLGAACQVSL